LETVRAEHAEAAEEALCHAKHAKPVK